MSNEIIREENGRLIEQGGKPKHGDIINGFPYLPPEKRRKILVLSDDL